MQDTAGDPLDLVQNLAQSARSTRMRKAMLDAGALAMMAVLLDEDTEPAEEPTSADTPRSPPRRRRRRPIRKLKSAARAPRRAKAPSVPRPRPVASPQTTIASIPPVEKNGVSINVTTGAESISYKGATCAVGAKQACMVLCLAGAMPNPVDRSFLIKKVWPTPPRDMAEMLLDQCCGELLEPLGRIGLKIEVTRGVGVSLREQESA